MTNIITESDLRHYAVAILFVDEETLLFQVRSEQLLHQPGDICFPGGAVEEGESPREAVIRELKEELLVEADQIEVLEESGILINDTSIIHCFPCRIHGYKGGFNKEEVDEVFRVPLSFFANTPARVYEVDWKPVFPEDFPFDQIHGGRNYKWRSRKSRIRFYEYEGHVIWGITAKITEHFVNRRKDA